MSRRTVGCILAVCVTALVCFWAGAVWCILYLGDEH